ncbi:MAG: hypothetical protein LH477_09940 [Nocardioides sp.]|nr:hypothetical protein [Nocardioides sp.]
MFNTVTALPYELARLPLVLVDHALSDKLPETSRPRVALDRAIGSADRLAGTLLANRDISERGTARIERSDKLLAAACLEAEATTRRQQARETAADGRGQAARKRKAAQDRAASGLEEAAAAQARGKQQAKATATKAARAKKAAADRRAASRIAAVEERKSRVDSAAEAEKAAAQRQAKDELDDAAKTKRSAAEARADAARLSDLVEAAKQQRAQD